MPATYVATRDIPLDQLTKFPGNARRGSVDQIRASIRRTGQYRSLVVRQHGDSLTILAGNHTRDALKAEGHTTARCEVITCDDDEARRINLADNRIAELGTYDEDALAELLSYLDGDYDGTGYTQEDVDALIAPPPEVLPPAEDPDQTPEPPANPICQPGDVWLLGPHRIICGDCRDYETVAKLVGDTRINVAFTSPPYASQRKYDESSGFKPIHPDEYVDWFEKVQANIRAVLADDGSWFVNIKEHSEDGVRHLYVKDLTIAHVRRWGWRFVDELIWVHNGLPGTWDNRHKNQFEPIFHFSANRRIKFNPLANGIESADAFNYTGDLAPASTGNPISWSGSDVERKQGLALPGNVLRLGKSHEAVRHEAMFPVALPAWFLRAYSDSGDTVLDPFMGAGSTLIAAHQENRVAYGIEISPTYCDVICRRYQEHTGTKPVHAETGQAVDFTTEPANQ